jgi:hypothetical protein
MMMIAAETEMFKLSENLTSILRKPSALQNTRQLQYLAKQTHYRNAINPLFDIFKTFCNEKIVLLCWFHFSFPVGFGYR